MTALVIVVAVLALIALLLAAVVLYKSGRLPSIPWKWIAGIVAAVAVAFVLWLSWDALGAFFAPRETGTTSWKSPSLATVVGAARDYWLWIFILWGVVAVLAAVFCAGTTAKTLQWVLAGVVFMLFIGLPVVNLVFGDKPKPLVSGYVRSEIPLASAPLSSWPRLVIPAGGKSERVSVPPGMHIVMKGNSFLLHNVRMDGSECAFGEQGCVNGPALAGAYATNKAQETNTIYYAFDQN